MNVSKISYRITNYFSRVVKGVLCLVVFFLPGSFIGQSVSMDSPVSALLDSTLRIYGSSDLLVNGPVYYQSNRLASGTPFIFSSGFEKSIVYVSGKSFNDVELNYDIVDQKLILLNQTFNEMRMRISLSDILIDSFLLKSYLFINPNRLYVESHYPYMLLVNNDRYNMLIGYKKQFINRISQKEPYGMYGNANRTLFLASDSVIFRISSKKSFLNTCPSKRKELVTFMRKNRIKLFKATPEQLKQLMVYYNHQQKLSDE